MKARNEKGSRSILYTLNITRYHHCPISPRYYIRIPNFDLLYLGLYEWYDDCFDRVFIDLCKNLVRKLSLLYHNFENLFGLVNFLTENIFLPFSIVLKPIVLRNDKWKDVKVRKKSRCDSDHVSVEEFWILFATPVEVFSDSNINIYIYGFCCGRGTFFKIFKRDLKKTHALDFF